MSFGNVFISGALQDCSSDLISRFLQEVFDCILRCFFVVFCTHKDCICFTSFVDRTLDDENRDLYGAIVCVSLGLKKSGDFIVFEGHGYALVVVKLPIGVARIKIVNLES